VSEVTATRAARSFANLLDAVEHLGESFVIVRRGKAVATLAPMKVGRGADVKRLLRKHPPDRTWIDDVSEVRTLIQLEQRP
jgi:antitoxin (DNA-binding transcriptional repressor) of toxin-antitoxin stability system